MFKPLFVLTILVVFLILLQQSFLVHFFSWLPNLILILVFSVNLLEEREKDLGIFLALFSGFFLDIFSVNYFGFYTIIFIFFAFSIKIILKNYFKFNF